MIDDEDFELEVVTLPGAEEAIAVEAEVMPTAPVAPTIPPEIQEVADEILSSFPRVSAEEAIAFAREWSPKLGPDRFFAIFWRAITSQTKTLVELGKAMQEALLEGQKVRPDHVVVTASSSKPAPPVRREVYRECSEILRKKLNDTSFDHRKALAEMRARLNIK